MEIDLTITETGAIVSRQALDDYNDAYLAAGNREDALAVLWTYAKREDWARARVKSAGKDWDNWMAKFDGTVMPR
jgi:hypothetical protein